MSASEAKKYAKYARSDRTVEGKLDYIAKAIEQLADAVDEVDRMDRRLKNVEHIVVAIANRMR